MPGLAYQSFLCTIIIAVCRLQLIVTMGLRKHFLCTSLALFFIIGALTCQSTAQTLQDGSMYETHEQWMAHYGRVYKDAKEKAMRYKIFEENFQRINSFNSGADKSYRLAVNQFADLTNEEFKASRNGFMGHMCSAQAGPLKHENVSRIPASIDWRKKGAVTPIKDQGQCGSCWGFSAVAAVEGIHEIKTGKLIDLSEQEIVDCDAGDNNCQGGLIEDAFKFIVKHGLASEATYPYNASDSTCNTKAESKPSARITGYEDVPAKDETALAKAVANQPVSVAIDAGGFDFQFYSSGVFNGSCGTKLDHGVVIVGYGVGYGKKYWVVKNSWGKQWGEGGYIRMQKDVAAKEGLCGIAMQASYPTA